MLIFTTLCLALILPIDGTFNITLLHNNDIHARFEEINSDGGPCETQCFGGIARMAHVIRKIRNQSSDKVLYLNAGDSFTGTPLFSIYKENITAEVMNYLRPDALTLGNHEFHFGREVLTSFLQQLSIPVVVTNLNFINSSSDFRGVKSSIVAEVSGHRVGIVGYVTPSTRLEMQWDGVNFLDEVTSVSQEVERLQANGINIIIALAHSGLDRDLEVARKCPGIAVIIGGHSHTLLHNGALPGERVTAEYPQVVKTDGSTTLVVQVGKFGKFLGHLELSFNEEEQLEAWWGDSQLLDESIPQESDALELLESFKEPLRELEVKTIGQSLVHLDGTSKSCRLRECNMGNLITDAIFDAYLSSYKTPSNPDKWSDVAGVLTHSGSMRSALGVGEIKFLDLKTAFPYENTFEVVKIPGSSLKDALEHSVAQYSRTRGFGRFLQTSGIHVTFNLDGKPGFRVTSAKILCTKCKIPTLETLNPKELYQIIVPAFIRNGGDGFTQFQNSTIETLPFEETEALVRFIKKMSPIYPKIEGRIKFQDD